MSKEQKHQEENSSSEEDSELEAELLSLVGTMRQQRQEKFPLIAAVRDGKVSFR